MQHNDTSRLDRAIDPARDHVLGDPAAPIVLLEYGSYACPSCHEAHAVISRLRDEFGPRLCYVFRHRPISNSDTAHAAAVLAETATVRPDGFWPVHSHLMTGDPVLEPEQLARAAEQLGLPPPGAGDPEVEAVAEQRVCEDRRSAAASGAFISPTFFINNRRYDGAWDEASLSEALVGSLGFRARSATLDFVRWGPSAGIVLLLMSVLAVILANSPVGPAFQSLWTTPLGIDFGGRGFSLPLLGWINDGLLSVFFLVVGLEIKREFTIGQLAGRRAAALPVAAAVGGMLLPAALYALIAPAALAHGWGTTISTDTAFAIALIVFLGDRVPVALRVFLTAAAIIDDLAAIAVVALFYGDALSVPYLLASVLASAMLMALNRWNVYRPLPYAVLGLVLWFCLHEAGIHATLAGVVLALVTPTRPPANLRALNAQAQMVFEAEARDERDMPSQAPSRAALDVLDAIHSRLESPAARLLRVTEPWSSYFVLPLFALANAGVVVSLGVLDGHGRLMLAIITGLVVGKPAGIAIGAWLAARMGWAHKPDDYTWRQLVGAGLITGIGFTMSLFIAGRAFAQPEDFDAAKIAIFIASILAGAAGVLFLWHRPARRQPG
ncbi:sodium:proton antiporter [Lysobacter arseniciresistens ZS79]|uniref:Na(+)/H(+) antiporter NhaA n=1 Tax=Lysobacter arseniciresistens ZS79 TaxID=913325 RepID=A0A0A0F5S6_9GAMM|nr:Na+/H+ antiporter NhaA [Lysobacter arseniciresistens]KGM57723.1 sodium:proton antiporter [Lysobacter arseniciresistens ZS79]